MCGIVGILGVRTEVALPAVERMRAAAAHRGPDDAGISVVRGPERFASAVLAHTRLSIVELSAAGHQPMLDAPRAGLVPNALTFNGEIYNFRELQPELAARGWPCRSGSDSEVILNAYRVWGVRAVERFEGMFAFALLDVERGIAVLARDRMGMKPLYVCRPAHGGLLFASEVRTLLAAGGELVPPRLNRRALESFFAQGAVASDHSIVEGVRMLGPGEALTLDFDGRPLRSVRYWSVAFGSDSGERTLPADGSVAEPVVASSGRSASSRESMVAELSADLRRSLQRLLLADVPVGLFLSSGVDSTALACVAAEVSAEPLRTIAVGFDVAALDESEGAGRTAAELGTRHQRIQLSGASVLASLDDVLTATDQPTVDGFNTFFTSRAAREAGLKVALSGVGGDELFGGYATFRDVPRALRLLEHTRHLGVPARRRFGALAARLGGLPLFGRRGRALAKLGEALMSPGDLVSLYLLRRELVGVDLRRRLHPLPAGSDPWSGLELDTLDELTRESAGTDPLDRVAALEFSMYMRHMLLRDADVFSMVHHIELRLPLLEHYTVGRAASARGAWRRPDPRPKPLLVDAVGSRLPDRVWRGKKRGFTFPWQTWLSGPLRERAAAALESRVLAEAGLEPRAVSDVWRRFLAGDRRVSALEVLALVVLEGYLSRHRLS
jgi:asparagine synthase (glutamine-hydrolysing)